MDRTIYDQMAAQDATHWWYRGRREVLASLIARRVPLPEAPRILEIGCGTGHNLAMLGRFGSVEAIEIDPASRAIASERLGKPVSAAPLPDLSGFSGHGYDMIALLDVLEHIEDDRAALRSIAARLAPGGTILLTVPQHGWMWSGHDVANHHFRRYSKSALRRAVADAGLKLDLLQSFNSLLFPAAVAARLAAKVRGREGADDSLPPPAVNAAFQSVFAAERFLIGFAPMPTGLSLVALISAPKASVSG